jgi:hypothetical protein
MDIFRFRKFAVNNGIASGQKAMPMKDSTSDGTSSFSLDRHNYSEALNVQTVSEIQHKKWIGGNRDASQVATNRRVANVGVGSLNASAGNRRVANVGVGSLNASAGNLKFVSNSDRSVVDNALIRVRAGGAVVPRKVAASPHIRMTPSFASSGTKSLYGVKQPYLYH